MSIPHRGADTVIQALRSAGLHTVFTLSGNHIMSIFDAAIGQDIALIHTRHEAAAVSMAEAYARMTGTVGVALVTGGAGHINALGALFTARAGETPLLLLSGHAPRAEQGNGSFQELDQAAMALPVTKASWVAQSAATLGQDIAHGLRIARSGRPGPVHISLPADLLDAETTANAVTPDMTAQDRFALPPDLARKTLDLLRAAKRPLILTPPALCTAAGRHARARLSRLGVPVIPMESPRGLSDPALGKMRDLLHETDLVVLLGKALDFTLDFGAASAADCRWIVIDPEQTMLQRAVRLLADRIALLVQADPLASIEALLQARADETFTSSAWRATAEQKQAHRTPDPVTSPGAILTSATLCRALNRFLAAHPNPILISDGGEIGQWAQASITTPDRIINGISGTIGPSIPFAIGARAAAPDRLVLAALGDGTFGFHMAEFETAVRHGLPFIAIVGNDGCWNAERQLQLRKYGADRAIGCNLDRATRYDQVSQALGGHGELVQTPDALLPALHRAVASNRPACVNVLIEGLPAPKMA